jgi:hypothetical protein
MAEAKWSREELSQCLLFSQRLPNLHCRSVALEGQRLAARHFALALH